MRPLSLALVLGLAVAGLSCTRRSGASGGGCSVATGDDCRPSVKMDALDGTSYGDEALAGHIVLVNFWATWCPPCAHELPALEAVYRRHKKDGFLILGVVAADRATDAEVKNFAGMRGVTYPLLRSSPDVERRFGLGDALPTTLLYDRSGRLRARWNGALREAELEAQVRQILAK